MKLCVITGEASGDLHAADVIRQLRFEEPALEIFGIGGDRLAAEGVRLLERVDSMAIMGLFNVLRHIPMYRRIFKGVVNELETQRPDAVLLVDFPDFNLRVARECKRLGIPAIYFISPQLWAWRRSRIKQIQKLVDLMLVIFPFEESFYRNNSVNAHYVGHPLVDQLAGLGPRSMELPEGRQLRILLLPGSRRSEVESLIGPMLDAVDDLRADFEVDVTLVRAPTIDPATLAGQLAGRDAVKVVEAGHDHFSRSDIAIAASGTVTLECAIAGLPVIVVYRLGTLTYLLVRRLVKIPHFSLVNIVGEKKVVPELLQDEVTGRRIAQEVRDLVRPETYRRALDDLAAVRARLGEGGAAKRAAEKIATLLRQVGGRQAAPGNDLR